MIKTTDSQKLDFLENLLEKNSQIRLQYEQYFQSTEQLDTSISNNTLDALVCEIFNTFESIDTSSWMESDCHCYGDYGDFSEEMYENILEDIFEPYKNIILSNINRAHLYEAVFQIAAIYKACLQKPVIQDDEYYIFGEAFDVHVEDYLSNVIIKNLTQTLQSTLFSQQENIRSINFLISVTEDDENFKLNIFTPIFEYIITNENEVLTCKESIELFSPLTQLHIYETLQDDISYIKSAKKFYLEDRAVATLLLSKLEKLNKYEHYVTISEDLFEQWPQIFAPIILHVIEFSKTPELYKSALQEQCLNNKSLQEYIDLAKYLNSDEIKIFRQRVKASYHQLFYINILEYEKMYDEILKIAQSNTFHIELIELIKPIKKIYPDAVLLLVKNYCDSALTSHGRSRSTYKRMAECLHVIYDVVAIKEALKSYIRSKLYNHTPSLPALRDELSKAKLV